MNNDLTQSAKKTLHLFEEFVRKEEVASFIKELRKELNLPSRGIPFTDADKKALTEPISAFLYTPERVILLAKLENENRALQACNFFANQQGHNSIYMGTLLRFYVFFDETMDFILSLFSSYNDYLRIEHLPSELSSRDEKFAYNHFKAVSENYPVVLLINPEVSQRQIQDFVSKNWEYIQSFNKNKNVSPQRSKKKKIQKRNDFIYENKHLPRKEIMTKVADKFGSDEILDYGYIGKIISLEKKRRENK